MGAVAETGQSTGRDLRRAAKRFIVGTKPSVTSPVIWRVEEEAPAIYWILYTRSGEARHAIAAGMEPKSWRLIDDGAGWPVA